MQYLHHFLCLSEAKGMGIKMKIDGNEKAMKSIRLFYEGKRKEAAKLDAEFRKAVLASEEDHCSCKISCEIH